MFWILQGSGCLWSLEPMGPTLCPLYWVAVKELSLSYHIGETILILMYTHHDNLI